MKVALLCAIVFGAISVAASSSHYVADEQFIQRGVPHRSSAASKAKRDANGSKVGKKEHLLKPRDETSVVRLGVDALKGALGDGAKGGETIINHYHASPNAAAAHMPGGAPMSHPPAPYYPPPAYGHDPGMAAKFDKLDQKLGKLKEGHKANAQQIQIMQELQAKQMQIAHAEASGAQAAAAVPAAAKKRGMSKTKMALLGGGGLAAGYGLTKVFDTKPSDSTTAYNQQDMAALQAAGGAAPGSTPVDGYPQGADPSQGAMPQGAAGQDPSSGGASGGSAQIADGPYRIPGSDLVWVTDRQGQYHVLKYTPQGMVEVNPPAGWQPPSAAGSGAAPGTSGGAGAPVASDGSAGASTGADGAAGGAGSAAGANPVQSGDSSSSGAGKGAGGQNPNGASQDAQTAGAAGNQSGGSPKPEYDSAAGMYYVVGPNSVKYYIDSQTGYLINANTGDVSDPKTGKIVYSAEELMNGATGNENGAGQGQSQANGGGQSSGAGAGAGNGRMQKRSLRHRKLDKRDYANAAFQASSPALREQAQLALLRGPNQANPGALSGTATKAGPGLGKMAAKGALGVGALVALVLGLGAYAHPTRPNTTPDNEYGLTPTSVCDMYGEPIIRDFRGVLWNKSTYTRVDLNHPPPLHQCSEQELADAGVSVGGGAGGAAPMQKRASKDRDAPQDRQLLAAVRENINQEHLSKTSSVELSKRSGSNDQSLEKRGMSGVTSLLPSMTTSGTMAVGATLLITAIYLHNIHKEKLQALKDQWNGQYHSAGDAASAVGNAIDTGANGQLFNPITGNLVLVDATTNMYYDSGTGEQVNPKTGMPFKYGGGDNNSSESSDKQAPVHLPLDRNGNMSGDSPEVQQALAKWNTMSPQQQQQLLAQYGDAASQILNSPDPNAALQAWSAQQGAAQPIAPQLIPQQQQLAPQQYQTLVPGQQQSPPASGGAFGSSDTAATSDM